jgi:thymidylate synthase
MKAYLDIVRRILAEGERKPSRTGVDTIAIAGATFEHDMAKGFPLLTTKRTPFRLVATELEFFVRGITDKRWLQARNVHIWDEWAHPRKAAYGHDAAAKRRMLDEPDLGPIYGFQWRHFGASYVDHETDYANRGVDQLARVVDTLKGNPDDRRMIVSAWNPTQLAEQGLPPCHFVFQVTVIGGKLNLLWNQRSVDVPLGLPFNIASYGLLLHLLAKEAGLREGRLIGFLADTHVYVNQLDGIREQLTRDPERHPLPRVVTEPFTSIWEWSAEHSAVEGYESYPKIDFPIAV